MEASQILQSNILDILFDGKNKLYGAYSLRKTYNRRLYTALIITFSLVLSGVLVSTVLRRFVKPSSPVVMTTPPITIREIPKDELKPIIPKAAKPASAAPTTKYSIPMIAKDNLVPDPPPDVVQIENANIDDHTLPGSGAIGIINPPAEITGSDVGAKIESRQTKQDSTFMPVEIEAQFPGGPLAWQRFIQKAINAQLDEFTDKDYGTCTVQFTVDKDGIVSEVKALNLQGTRLAEISVNAIRKGPRWTPAVQNGRYVSARRLQPVTLLNPNN